MKAGTFVSRMVLLLTMGAILSVAPRVSASDCLGAWTQRAVAGPSARETPAMAYHAVSGTMILFGGYTTDGYNNETWQWNGQEWQNVTLPGGNPPPRKYHAMAYDAGRQRTVLFGGTNGGYLGDTWEWDGSVWVQASTTGPSPRHVHAMAYDAQRGVTVLFGGFDSQAGGEKGDTWEWNGGTWTDVTPAGQASAPSARHGHAMAYDARRKAIVLFGGHDGTEVKGDTWTWNGNTWTQVADYDPQAPDARPSPRHVHAMAYDNARGVVMLFGGALIGGPYLGDTWEWDGQTWTKVTDAGPSARHAFGIMAHDSGRRVTVLFGGWTPAYHYMGDTWEYSGPPVRPIADAGNDQSRPEGTVVTLNGGQSLVPCGEPSYAWAQVPSDYPVNLNLTDPVHPTFAAPQVPRGGATLTFQLIVSDGTLSSAPDFVNVTVTNVNHAPVADAGDDQKLAEDSPVTLDGSGSYDEDDDLLTFYWEQTDGTPVILDANDPVHPKFTAPLVGPSGDTLVFELVVNDGEFDSPPDTVRIQVDNVPHPPVADAGEDQTKDEGATVTLDATKSYDPDGDELTFEWTQLSGPTVILSDPNSPTPSFTAPLVGFGGATLVFQVIVRDIYGLADDDAVEIAVQYVIDPPRCDLGRPSVDSLWPPNHKLVPITIAGVTDPDNDQVTITILYVTQDEPLDGLGDGDTAPDAVIQGGTVLLRAERSGTGNGRVYVITFQADDGAGGVCTGQMTVTVPRDRRGAACIDDGQSYPSLQP